MKCDEDCSETMDILCDEIELILNDLEELDQLISEKKNQKICPACGAKIAKDSKFCSKCGAPVEEEKPAPEQPAEPEEVSDEAAEVNEPEETESTEE